MKTSDWVITLSIEQLLLSQINTKQITKQTIRKRGITYKDKKVFWPGISFSDLCLFQLNIESDSGLRNTFSFDPH